MRRAGGFLLLSLLVAALLVPSLAAPAATGQEEPPPPAQETTTDIEPAVPVTTPPAVESTPDWTYRYLIPTGVVLAALIVLVTTVRYFTSVVRKRYRIIRE